MDCSVDGKCNIQNFESQDSRASVHLDPGSVQDFAWATEQNKLAGVDLRLVIVQDLNKDLIKLLGSLYDLDPEFFAEHLRQSGHEREGKERFALRTVLVTERLIDEEVENGQPHEQRLYVHPDRQNQSIQSPSRPSALSQVQTMHKSFRSFRWYRPVELRPLRKIWLTRRGPGEPELTTPDLELATPFSGICRLQHWEFRADESMAGS